MNVLLISLERIVHIGIPVLAVFSVVGLIISLLVRNKQAQIENRKLVNKELIFEEFSTNDPTKKAQAFLELVSCCFIMIAKLVNGGGKYDDEQQSIRFKQFLTSENAEIINSMDVTRNG